MKKIGKILAVVVIISAVLSQMAVPVAAKSYVFYMNVPGVVNNGGELPLDVRENRYFEAVSDVALAGGLNDIVGEKGNYKPTKVVKHHEFTRMAYNYLGSQVMADARDGWYSTEGATDAWARKVILKMTGVNLGKGTKKPLTREKACYLLYLAH